MPQSGDGRPKQTPLSSTSKNRSPWRRSSAAGTPWGCDDTKGAVLPASISRTCRTITVALVPHGRVRSMERVAESTEMVRVHPGACPASHEVFSRAGRPDMKSGGGLSRDASSACPSDSENGDSAHRGRGRDHRNGSGEVRESHQIDRLRRGARIAHRCCPAGVERLPAENRRRHPAEQRDCREDRRHDQCATSLRMETGHDKSQAHWSEPTDQAQLSGRCRWDVA